MLGIWFFYGGASLLILRLILGALFIAHGWPKIKNLKQNAKNFDGMGFRPGAFFGTVAAFLEFFGGIALVLGFLVGIVTGLFILQFITIIIWKWTKKMPFVGGWEIDFLILGALIILFTLGAGAYSLDRVILFGL